MSGGLFPPIASTHRSLTTSVNIALTAVIAVISKFTENHYSGEAKYIKMRNIYRAIKNSLEVSLVYRTI